MFEDKFSNSPRIITDGGGAVISRHDYMAFGDEIYAGVGGRTANQKYSQVDNIRQQYTGYQRDTESGLDYAQARYYNSQHGRFTSVDPLTASANVKNPQTFNRYAYVTNSPYKFVDPLGLFGISSGGSRQGDVLGLGNYDANGPRNTQAEAHSAQPPSPATHELINSITEDTLSGESQTSESQSSSSPYIPPPPIDSSLAGSLEYQEEKQYYEKNTARAYYNPKYTIIYGYPDGTFFSTSEEAAIYQLQRSNSLSIEINREIPAAVYRDRGFVVIVEGEIGTVDRSTIPTTPDGTTRLAEIHTHGAADSIYLSEIFSPADKIGFNSRVIREKVVNNNDEIRYQYLGTPSGRILRHESIGLSGVTGPVITLPQRTQ